MLASVLAGAAPGLQFNEHLDEEDGPLVFLHTCKLGLFLGRHCAMRVGMRIDAARTSRFERLQS
ncbi:MAG: hypothetical protein WBZ51_31090 [Xanthobacteraceae bacterium]